MAKVTIAYVSALSAWAVAALALVCPVPARAQVIITASDFFNKPGQYYRAYAQEDVAVSGRLGSPGAVAQAWDFTDGSQALVYRYDYVPVSEGPDSTSFPDAVVAERLRNESTGTEKWLYFEQIVGDGRLVHGFHDPDFSDSMPTSVFQPPIRDFPDTIRYGDTWKTSTEFDSEISFGIPDDGEDGGGLFTIPTRIQYSSTATVDAFGIINQPGIGFGECQRVNELVRYDIEVDLGLGEGFQNVSTQFVRNYYWLRKGHGIAVQVTSRQQDTEPANDFASAAMVARMFETNHEAPVVEQPAIRGLKITLGKEGALLQWTKLSGVTRYRVEFAAAIGAPWQTLVDSTAANFALDPAAAKEGAPSRVYRVVGFE